MTVKVKYEDGVLKPMKEIPLENGKVYDIDLKILAKKKTEVKGIKAKDLRGLVGIVSIGGDALKDSEKIYDE